MLIINTLTDFSTEFLFIFDKRKRMLKYIFQQVLKFSHRTKLPEKRPKQHITDIKPEH